MQKTCQMRALVRGHIEGLAVKRGDVFWTTPAAAHQWKGLNFAEIVGDRPGRPAAAAPEAPEKNSGQLSAASGQPSVDSRQPSAASRQPVGVLQRGAHWPLDRFGRVEKVWQGATVVCIATGPSLTQQQVDRTQSGIDRDGNPVHVIAVSDGYRFAPWADVCYFADAKWWKWHREKPEFVRFRGAKCTIFSSGNGVDDADVFILRKAGTEGLSLTPTAICTGSNSGYQGINIAALSGARRIVLIGYDARRGADGRRHSFGDHPDKTEPPYETIIARFRTLVKPAADAGIEILNATPGSAIPCFRKVEFESLVPDPPAALLSA